MAVTFKKCCPFVYDLYFPATLTNRPCVFQLKVDDYF